MFGIGDKVMLRDNLIPMTDYSSGLGLPIHYVPLLFDEYLGKELTVSNIDCDESLQTEEAGTIWFAFKMLRRV